MIGGILPLKYGIFSGSDLLVQGRMPNITLADMQPWVHSLEVQNIVAASTGGPEPGSLLAILKGEFNVLIVQADTPVPVSLEYKTPHTLGVDRKAVAVAAAKQWPDAHSLVIDCGTCITYDLVAPGKRYLGGAISPGLRMRLKAMNTFTAQLPLVGRTDSRYQWPGQNTKNSLWTGALKGYKLEVEGYIRSAKQEYQELNVILTGGDAIYFESIEKMGIFADPFFVLRGLNEIFGHNART